MRLHRYEEAAQWLAGYHPVQLQTGSLQQFLIPVLQKECTKALLVFFLQTYELTMQLQTE